jgi:drug/metabolite transporter (DMT)-like permease
MNQPIAPPSTPTRRWPPLPLPLLELAMVLCWSSGFVGARFSIDYAPAALVVLWRCVLLSLLLGPWVLGPLRRASWPALLHNAGIGLLAMGGYLAGVTEGIALGVPTGLAALIADLLPIGMALIAAATGGRPLGRQAWLGLSIGFAGVLLVAHEALSWGSAPGWAYALPLLGMLSLAVASLWQNRLGATQALGLLTHLWLQCCVSAIVFAALASLHGTLWPIPTWGFAVSVLWTAGVATLGGYGLYWVCLRRSGPTRVASVLYLSPAVTLVWAWMLFDEPLSWLMLVGTAVSALGIWQVMRAPAADKHLPRCVPSGARPE